MNQEFPARRGKSRTFGLLFVFLGRLLIAQNQSAQIELNPANPTDKDSITFTLSGVWGNGCVPQSPKVSITPGAIRIETSNPSAVCTLALTPWTLAGSLGMLAPAEYQLTVTYSSPSVSEPLEIGRRAFTVAGSSSANEIVLPIVANGALGEKTHYQTIFTVLNTSAQDVRTTLQIYSNAGTATGVFCSPILPALSSITTILSPGAELSRFTSADLPFLNGWARLRWEGSPSILASTEVTLITAPPAPCMLVCNRPSTEKLASVQITAIRPAREFRLPVTLNTNRQTAVAIVNPSPVEIVNVTVSIRDISGGPANLGVPNSFSVRIGPQQRISRLLWEMALEHAPAGVVVAFPEMLQGSVILTADIPFAVGALNIMFPEGKFVSIPTLPPVP